MERKFNLNIFPLAQKDMENIFKYISVDLASPMAANNLIDDFENAFENIRLFPESCPLIQNEYVKDKTLRKLVVNNYIVFYKVEDFEIQVVRVIYGMRNYEDLL
jgi:addiction module RelE/StbE family toxin